MHSSLTSTQTPHTSQKASLSSLPPLTHPTPLSSLAPNSELESGQESGSEPRREELRAKERKWKTQEKEERGSVKDEREGESMQLSLTANAHTESDHEETEIKSPSSSGCDSSLSNMSQIRDEFLNVEKFQTEAYLKRESEGVGTILQSDAVLKMEEGAKDLQKGEEELAAMSRIEHELRRKMKKKERERKRERERKDVDLETTVASDYGELKEDINDQREHTETMIERENEANDITSSSSTSPSLKQLQKSEVRRFLVFCSNIH